MGVVWGCGLYCMGVVGGVWLPVPDLGSEKLATMQQATFYPAPRMREQGVM